MRMFYLYFNLLRSPISCSEGMLMKRIAIKRAKLIQANDHRIIFIPFLLIPYDKSADNASRLNVVVFRRENRIVVA